MKLLQKTINKEFILPKHKAKSTAPEKQSVVSISKQSQLFQNLKICEKLKYVFLYISKMLFVIKS